MAIVLYAVIVTQNLGVNLLLAEKLKANQLKYLTAVKSILIIFKSVAVMLKHLLRIVPKLNKKTQPYSVR